MRRRSAPRPSSRICSAGYWGPILRLGGLVVALNVVNYTLLTLHADLPGAVDRPVVDLSLVVPIIGMLAMMVFLPFAGGCRTGSGANRMWWFSLVGLFVAGVPMFMLMGTNVTGAVIGFAVLGLLYVPQLATISATFPAMFPTHVRYAGLRDRLQRVDVALRRHRARGQRVAGRQDRRRPGARLLHDGRLRHRRDRPDHGARDHPLPDQRHGDPRHPKAPPQLDYA